MTVSGCLSANELQWIEKLKSLEYNQAHLVEKAGDTNNIKEIISQIDAADKTYPGGLLNYLKRARNLLAASKNDVNPYEGYKPTVPLGESLRIGTPEFDVFEKVGMEEFGKVAFVLVAGGLGERLGFPGIKISLPLETLTGMTYIEYYMKMILAIEIYVEKIEGVRPRLPLGIMTSDDTHDKTVAFLQSHGCFGFPAEQLTIMKQEKVPALIDSDAHIAMTSSGRIEMKPHGHGDVHTLLNQHGLPEKWLKEGREWLFLFQDTNGLISHGLAPVLGVSKKLDLVMNSLAIQRKAGEAAGAICKLQRIDSESSLTINVEYNQLNPLLKANGFAGDVPDESGHSAYPGNTNVLLFNLKRYHEVLKATSGTVPEFVNPKYSDATKIKFKSATRLECMMQDLPRLFGQDDKVGFTLLDRWLCFSTLKNNIIDAALKANQGIPAESAFTAEADYYYANARMLEIAANEKCDKKVNIVQPSPATFLNVPYKIGPLVVIHPSFGITLNQLKDRIHGGSFELFNRSVLILEGDVSIEGLVVNGALGLAAKKEGTLSVKNLQVQNKGYELETLEKDNSKEPIHLQMRGYKIRCDEMSFISA